MRERESEGRTRDNRDEGSCEGKTGRVEAEKNQSSRGVETESTAVGNNFNAQDQFGLRIFLFLGRFSSTNESEKEDQDHRKRQQGSGAGGRKIGGDGE